MALLDNGGRLVVIGARESNVRPYWDDPRFIFMDGDQAVRRGLPANARGIVFTRFLNHTHFEALVAEARKRNLTVFPLQNTGELKRLLAQLTNAGHLPARPPELPPPAPVASDIPAMVAPAALMTPSDPVP